MPKIPVGGADATDHDTTDDELDWELRSAGEHPDLPPLGRRNTR